MIIDFGGMESKRLAGRSPFCLYFEVISLTLYLNGAQRLWIESWRNEVALKQVIA